MESYNIAIASDHAGFCMKEFLVKYLLGKGCAVKDMGTYGTESVDYPDYIHPLAEAIASGEFSQGIALCGSGVGVSIVLNRHKGVRAALCWTEEIGRLARMHNNANVCCLPARFITEQQATAIVDAFLSTGFEGGRHQVRVEKIEG